MKSSSCTAAQVSLLTVYDMCKAVDRMVMSDIRVMEKHGGSREIGARRTSSAPGEAIASDLSTAAPVIASPGGHGGQHRRY